MQLYPPYLSQSIRLEYDAYNNGGEWLNAVFPTGLTQQLTGFVHAEDQFWIDGQGFTGHGKAFKSIALGKLCIKCVYLHLLHFSLQ